MEVMLAKKASKKLIEKMLAKYNYVIVQEKFDGVRAIYSNGTLFTREGKVIPMSVPLRTALRVLSEKYHLYELDGELVIYRGGKPLPRKEISGIINHAIHSEKALIGDVRYHVFDANFTGENTYYLENLLKDCHNVDSVRTVVDTIKHSYVLRLQRLHEALNDLEWNIQIPVVEVSSFYVESADCVRFLYGQMVAFGKEGVMVKSPKLTWKNGRSNEMLKMKEEKTADLEVCGVLEGSGKYEGKLGSILCRTKDKKLVVAVGTGLTDVQRAEFNYDNLIGKIIEVKYNAVIDKKDSDVKSLFLPVFIQVRMDKTKANTLEEL